MLGNIPIAQMIAGIAAASAVIRWSATLQSSGASYRGRTTFAFRMCRRLAQAFPHEFKPAYGNEVLQMGEDVMDEIARKHGTAGLFRLFADIVIRVPLEYLSEMRRDMRYAWRAMLKSPGFALTGIISIGIGIGLTTNVYSSKWQTLFRPLPRQPTPNAWSWRKSRSR